jgi:hypothetical protein
VAGYAGTQSSIYKFTLSDAGAITSLTSAVVAAQMPDGELVYHEVKGFFEEDAKVKCKAFITKYPFRLLIVKKDKKAWAIEEFHPVKESK